MSRHTPPYLEVGCSNKQPVRQAILPFLKGRTTIPFLSKTKVQLCRPQAQLLPGLRKPSMGMSYRIVQQFHLMGRMRLMFHQHGGEGGDGVWQGLVIECMDS